MKDRDKDLMALEIQTKNRKRFVKYLKETRRPGSLLLQIYGGNNADSTSGKTNAENPDEGQEGSDAFSAAGPSPGI